MKHPYSWDILLATVIFIGGLGFYFILRPPTLVAVWLGMTDVHINVSWLKYFNWIPSFSHVFAFSIFTWWSFNRTCKFFSLFLWITLNLLYEWAQLPSGYLYQHLSKEMQTYFAKGTYDNADFIAIALGGIAALWVMWRVDKKQ